MNHTQKEQHDTINAESQRPRHIVKRLEPADVMYTHQVGDGPAKGWVHTHGLSNVGLPELEIRDAQLLLGPQAAGLLEGIADYMLNTPDKPIVAGHTMRLHGSIFRFVEATADDEAGYDTNHYEDVTRLTLVDMDGEAPCDLCDAEQCHAREMSKFPAGVEATAIDCFVPVTDALDFVESRPNFGEQYAFVYDAYVPGGGAVFRHSLTPDTPITELLRLAALDYEVIDEELGLELHPLSDLAFEGVYINHKARTVTFSIGS